MPSFQYKVTRHANHPHHMAIHRKKEFTETALEKAQLMDFPEK
jgi:hypothetical protein